LLIKYDDSVLETLSIKCDESCSVIKTKGNDILNKQLILNSIEN